MQVNSVTPFTPGRAIPPLHRFGEPTQQARTQRQLLCRQTMPDTALSELVIRETSGQTVMQWINQAVILEAKVLLKHSNLLVFQISDELNFPNPSFFSKFFKRMTGMTPAEYQKQT